MPTLRDVLPPEFSGCEYTDTPARRHIDVEVVAQYTGRQRRWPGKHRNVLNWVALANGRAIGWNEGPQGWSFPVIRYTTRPPFEERDDATTR